MKRFAFFLLPVLHCVYTYAQDIDVQHYKFEIELSEQSDVINGVATVTVKFLKDVAEFNLDLVSLQEEKGMMAFQVREGKQLLQKAHSGDVLRIILARPAKKGEIRFFTISYMGTPKDGLVISKNKYGERTYFADNWPNRAHHWIPVNDRPDDKASFEFIVTAPPRFRVISNGVLVEEKDLSVNKKRTHWKETTPLSTKIMVIGVARFAVKQFPNSPKNIPVSAWVYPQDSTKGFYDYGVAVEIVKFFSDLVGPYPYKKLANVQSTTMFGGMENASAIFYDEDRISGDRRSEDLLAHEIVHQWFGDMASEKSFAHLWLSEGFATYLTDYYIEKKYGKDSAANRLQKEREQVRRFAEKNNLSVVDSTSSLMELLNANSYQKGAWILHMLRQETSDIVFRRILQAYYQGYKGRNADTRDFQKVVEKITNKKWGSFFDQWLYRPGIPSLNVQWRADSSKLFLTVQQKAGVYELPLTIGYNIPDGRLVYKTVRISKETEVFELPINAQPQNVLLDPLTQLLFTGTVSKE
jgi:aminopeptidase N